MGCWLLAGYYWLFIDCLLLVVCCCLFVALYLLLAIALYFMLVVDQLRLVIVFFCLLTGCWLVVGNWFAAGCFPLIIYFLWFI